MYLRTKINMRSDKKFKIIYKNDSDNFGYLLLSIFGLILFIFSIYFAENIS